MTLEQTRQLGIEFERRLLVTDPTLALVGKIDTEDIYAYLNKYLISYIRQMFAAEGIKLDNGRATVAILDLLKPLVVTQQLNVSKSDDYSYANCVHINLPEDYFLYVRSQSVVIGTYKHFNKPTLVQNRLVSQVDFSNVTEQYFDQHRILRIPLVALENPTNDDEDIDHAICLYDEYTEPILFIITYIKEPNLFTILGDNPKACELPYSNFDALVDGAVQMYFNDKYALAIATAAAKKRNNRLDLGLKNNDNDES